jgi:hypothetical protein
MMLPVRFNVRGSILPICLVSGILSPGGSALGFELLEYHLLHGVDTASQSPLVFNTSALAPEGSRFTFAELVRFAEVKSKRQTGDQSSEVKSEVSDTVRAVEFLAGGGGISFGGGVNHSSQEQKTTTDQGGNFLETPLLETFKRTEVRGKIGFDLSKDFRLGAVVRYKIIDVDVLGNLFFPSDERTKYSGSLLGAGASAQFNTESAGFAFQYVSPIQGKVEILGEDKVTSEPGLISACGHVSAAQSFAGGGCYIMPQYSKDELRERTTGPNPDNNTQMSPRGVSPEQDFFLSRVVVLGVSAGFTAALSAKLTAFLEDRIEVSDPNTLPGDVDDPGEVLKGYRGRLSFAYRTKDFFVEFGGDTVSREREERDAASGDTDLLTGFEYNLFGYLGLTF